MASITAPSLTLRSTKGSPLTNAEVDANFSNISTQIALGQTAASYTAADVLAKLITVDGVGSGLDADFLDGLNSATANTVSTIVARDASGNFAAGTITATLSGNASTANALTATLGVSAGGTGATSAASARTNLGVAIGSDVQAYDAELAALATTTSAGDALPYFTGVGTATTTSFPAYGRSLAASSSAGVARSTLGLVLGTDVQPFDGDLSAIGGLTDATGVYVKTAANTAALRTITAGAGISVTNGDGAAGNPTIAAAVTSVQGNTGAVTVSVPVTSVQGATGAITVTNIGGNAATATNVAYGGVQGVPTALSQFSNNLGNYGAYVDGGGGAVIVNCFGTLAVANCIGQQIGGMLATNAQQSMSTIKQGTNMLLRGGNCNCVCNC